MARKSNLHDLRILIAGQLRTRFSYREHHRVLSYHWGCGCLATGVDDEDLDVRHCDLHHIFMELHAQP